MAASSTINRCSYAGTLNDAGTNTVGGIVGYADQSNNVISNVINYGTVKSRGSDTNTGGILGYVNYAKFRIASCANVGTVSGNTTYAGQILGRQMKAMTTLPSNLYYLEGGMEAFGSGTEASSAKGATAVNAEQLASGEVCYKLNGDQEEICWYQTLPSEDPDVVPDPYPVLYPTHGIVLYNKTDGYYNAYDPNSIGIVQDSRTRNGGDVFDLSGRRISPETKSSLKKGVYIINGKKVLY